MPLFDLRCKNCGEQFTKIVSYEKLAETTCPHCSSKEHERIYKTSFTGPVNSSSSSSGSAMPSSGFT